MSAKVKPAVGPGWLAYCDKCDESQHGSMSAADLWTDVHNETCREEPHFGCPDCGERDGCDCRWKGVL